MTTPTEEEMTQYAELLFPTNLELQMSFTLGIWNSIINTEKK